MTLSIKILFDIDSFIYDLPINLVKVSEKFADAENFNNFTEKYPIA